ncbi:M57 family metalloprotease [Pedobacter jeongneungensis]|uniref:M57 family metalloprotease n=1 Tax=Pedobacter jeongneungensis TaxID=947309 RepID=UPI0004688090|nr:M57 family metalloprotease [Pedobacter jeongneungensis]
MKNLKKTKQLGIILCSSVLLLTMALPSCKKNGGDDPVNTKPEMQSKLTEAEEIRIMKAGFSTNDAIKVGDSYLVEGDILLSAEDLNHQIKLVEGLKGKNGPSTEQYKSGYTLAAKYLNNGQIKIKIDAGNLQKLVTDATVIAIKRYNDLKLATTFVLETSSTGTADIAVVMKDLGGRDGNGSIVLGRSGGFPRADSSPAPNFSLNNQYYNATDFTANALANVIAHEIGHCVGFRHTDYTDRKSCGFGAKGEPVTAYLTNAEGTAYLLDAKGNKIEDLTTTATLIPGTVTKDSKSWMGACNSDISSFTANDKTAIYYLLGKQ